MLVAMLQNSWPEETIKSNKWQPLFKSLSFGVFHYTELGNWNYRHCVCLIFCIDIWLLLRLGFLIFVSCCGTCLPININFLFILLSSTLLEHSAIDSLSAVSDFFQLKHVSLSFATKIAPLGIVWVAFQVFNVLHFNEGTIHENSYWTVEHLMNIETILKWKRNVLATVYSHMWKNTLILMNFHRMFIFEVGIIRLSENIYNIIYNRVGLADSVWIIEW